MRLAQAAIAIAWTLAVAGVCYGWYAGVPRLEAYAVERAPSQPPRIVLREFPAWLQHPLPGEGDQEGSGVEPVAAIKEGIIEEIRQAVRVNVGSNPFERGDLERARLALESTGWFTTVDRVMRTDLDVVEVEATFVEPFTMINSGGRNHLVARDGRLLPLSYPEKARLRLPLIVGARFAAPSRRGARWEGTDVAAGLELASILSEQEWVHQIVAIDISEFSRTRSLWLTTDRGARILWGRTPGEERGREVPFAQKIAYLDWFYTQYGRVDRGLSEIDIGLDVVVHAR